MICGIDEAGRGPLAGPVTAGAVILPLDFPFERLNDSKKLSERQRELLEVVIKEKAVYWAVVDVSHEEIDVLNIHRATLEAMRLCYFKLGVRADFVYVDGKFCPDLPVPCEAIIKGDSKIPEIMAASILAKTHRDRLMKGMAVLYPQWQFDKHKGYPTALHREICLSIGLSPIHRKSFRVTKPKKRAV